MSDFDLESLVHLEQSFFDSGYNDGFQHGRIHGLIEGRALGREKGYEMWEELGFYDGFARMWQEVYSTQGEHDDSSRAAHHIQHLLRLISQFPQVNPSSSSSSSQSSQSSDLDIPRLFRQIRSRYKALCSSLGVRPSLRASGSSDDIQEPKSESNSVWKVEQMSF